MKIALTTDSFVEGQGGVSTAVAALARTLSQRGHQVIVYSAADPSHKDTDLDVVGLWALRYERFPGGRAPVNPAKLTRELSRFHPDIIHNHSMSVMGIQALAAARLLDIPILGTCHVYLPGFLNYAPLPLEGQPMVEKAAWQYTTTFFNRFSYVTTPSEMMRQQLLSAGLRVPSTALSNGVDTNLFHPRQSHFHLHPQPLTLLHVGRLGYEKRVDVVLRAFGRLAPAFPQARLVIAGDGLQASILQSLANDLGIAHRVIFTGQVPRDQLPDLYRQADLFVTASTIETQGLVVLEAMASGLPIVGVDALALPELIHSDINGFLVSPGDDMALSEAMVYLLRSETLRQKMGSASRRNVMQHNLSCVTERCEEIYWKLFGKARPGWIANLHFIASSITHLSEV
jgi:1,2-diacylglycerol 3-alpha-glucosyltransferase